MLYYLVGASGVGKDSVLEELKYREDVASHIACSSDTRIKSMPPLFVAHRYITREQREGDENHIALNRGSFKTRKSSGFFLFDWESHGFQYGIGTEVNQWLESGHNVIVNGSRAYIEQARKIIPDLNIIWLSVDETILRERLISRGRETIVEIEARIQRNRALEKLKQASCITIMNDGLINQTVDQVLNSIYSRSLELKTA